MDVALPFPPRWSPWRWGGTSCSGRPSSGRCSWRRWPCPGSRWPPPPCSSLPRSDLGRSRVWKELFPSSVFLLIQSHSGWGPFQFIYELAALFKVVGRYFQSSEGSVVQEKFEASCQKSFGHLSGPFTDKGLFILALGKRLIQSWPM